MKSLLRIVCLAALASGLGIGLAMAQAAAKAPETKAPEKKASAKAVLWAAEDIKWVDVPEMKGGKQAVLWGDPKTGAYGAFNRFPGGTEFPLHTHTLTTKVVMVSGTLSIGLEGGAPKDLGPGSYATVPGAVKHATSCKAGADCVFFVEQAGKFDLKPVAAPGAKK